MARDFRGRRQLPVVAPNVDGVTTYGNTKNAWTVPPEPKEFANVIEAATSQTSDRHRRIAEALKTAAACRWENVAASSLDLYEDLASTAQNGVHRFPADFFSTLRTGKGSVTARFTANVVQGLLATR